MENLDLSEVSCLLFVGKPKKGKSNAIRYIILKNSLDKFKGSAKYEFGICFTRTKFNGDYDFLPEEYVYDGYDEEVLERYLKALEEQISQGKKVPANFVIFDDLIGLLSKNNPFLTNFLGTHRHTNTHIFLATQHLKTGASTTLREICSHAILFNSKQTNTLQSLFENFGQFFDTIGDFKDNFWDITREKFTAMLYLQDIDDINDNYLSYQAPDTSDWDYKLEY